MFAPDYAPEEITEIATKLRKSAGLPDEPTGLVANNGEAQPRRGRSKAKAAASAK